jgi:Zn finger protein HypA/HybF involved in hydrogenase expression
MIMKVAYENKFGRTLYRQVMSEEEFAMADEEGTGYCLACGESRGNCEPDARNYKCEGCGEKMVFGAAEMLLMGLISFE